MKTMTPNDLEVLRAKLEEQGLWTAATTAFRAKVAGYPRVDEEIRMRIWTEIAEENGWEIRKGKATTGQEQPEFRAAADIPTDGGAGWKDVEWVASKLKTRDDNMVGAPSAIAVSMYLFYRQNPQNEAAFWTNLYAKSLGPPKTDGGDAWTRERRVFGDLDAIERELGSPAPEGFAVECFGKAPRLGSGSG